MYKDKQEAEYVAKSEREQHNEVDEHYDEMDKRGKKVENFLRKNKKALAGWDNTGLIYPKYKADEVVRRLKREGYEASSLAVIKNTKERWWMVFYKRSVMAVKPKKKTIR